jgi:thiamine-phosphate pyrophosphorylase
VSSENSPVLDLAAVDALAEEAHRGQTRRHGAPYISHPRAVRRLVDDLASACQIPIDDGVRAAALLHDVIEDSPLTEAALAERVSPHVAAGVELLTKTGKGPEATTRYYHRMLAEAGTGVLLIKVADRCHNLSELHKAPDAENVRRYVEETLEHVVPLCNRHKGTEALKRPLLFAARQALRAQRLSVPAELELTTGRVPRGVYAIVHPEADVARLALRVRALCSGGVSLLQLRAKGGGSAGDDRFALETLAVVQHECDRLDVPVLVNDRADIALFADADGVHVGQTDVPASLVRRLMGSEPLVGTSTHNHHQAAAADQDPANDYLALGPIFPSPTKQGHADVLGIAELARVARQVTRPLCAIGGIVDVERCVDVARAGAHLAAVLSALEGDVLDDVHGMAFRMSLAFTAASAP